MSEVASPAPRGHNKPPITAPSVEDMADDLKARFPELDTRMAEFETALKTYPEELTLKDQETAAALQDLLGQMKKHKTLLGAHKKDEKKPWDGLVKVVQNFFARHDEKTDALLTKWQPIHEGYLVLKKDEARRMAEEEAEKQRKKEEDARQAAEQAERDRIAAQERAETERRNAETARLAAERAEQERQESVRRAAAAAAEEKRLADEKKVRDRAEKDRNEENLKSIRRYMKDAERLHALSENDEADDSEISQLDSLIKHGGMVGLLAAPVASSTLLDDEQRSEIEKVRARLNEMREAQNSRYNKREQAKREKARLAAEDQERKDAEERRLQREAEEKQLADARAAREAEEAETARLREERRTNEEAARTADKGAKGAEQDAKAAGKDVKALNTEADRAKNRGDRVERRLETTTDGEFSRTRGEHGTVGSLTGSWKHYITDEAALRAASGPLGEHFTEAALSGAAYRWMAAHREGFAGERVEGALAGVTFVWEESSRIA